MNYSVVKTIDPLHKTYQKIQELYLNHNLIESLTGVEQFNNLRVFHIKFNFISDLREFLKIANKTQLNSLNFIGNPAENELKEYPDFLNNFPNLRNFNTSKETSALNENSLSNTNNNSHTISRKLQFIEEIQNNREENLLTEGLITGNFNIRKQFQEEEENNETFQMKINEEDQLFDEHINHIDHDISRLSEIFYEKMLKEKSLLGLKRYFLQIYYRDSKFCVEFYQNILKNRTFFYWRKAFINKIISNNYKKGLKSAKETIQSKFEILSQEITNCSMLRSRKTSNNLRKITETDQDYCDSNRAENKMKSEKQEISNNDILEDNNILKENNSKINQESKKIGFSEYMEQTLKNSKKELIDEEGYEENYRHNLPLSTSFSSKCPYGSV